MTQAELTEFIDDKIRNKTPKVIKTEHADVEQAINDTLFDNVNLLTAIIGSLNDSITTIQNKLPLYTGTLLGLNLPVTSGSISHNGYIYSATGTGSGILVTLSVSMPSLNYKVRFDVESLGTYADDQKTACPMFKIVSTSQFYVIIGETANATQDLNVHLELISLD